jgi:hypothetical protein
MAKVAAAGSLTSNSLQIGGGTGLRRKTPSELRVSSVPIFVCIFKQNLVYLVIML